MKGNLNTDVILMGFALEEDGPHAPNESFSLNRVRKGIEAITRFLNL
jgi:acetylornithine deacetylase/succinyl-diaminopimelate desuccinylase-like protein